jgi:hypothetical protein
LHVSLYNCALYTKVENKKILLRPTWQLKLIAIAPTQLLAKNQQCDKAAFNKLTINERNPISFEIKATGLFPSNDEPENQPGV